MVAIVAAVALFLCATAPAGAAPFLSSFGVIPSLSTISTTQVMDVSALFGHPAGTDLDAFVPQFPDPDGAGPISGSDSTYVRGYITGEIDPGVSIELTGGLLRLAENNTPGDDFGTPGAFNPEDLGPGTPPVGPYPGGITYDCNFGFKDSGTYGLGLTSAMHDVVMTWATTDPSARPLSGSGEFNYVLQADGLVAVAGRRAVYSDIPNIPSLTTEGELTGSVIAALGTAGLAKPSWRPWDVTAGFLGTLRLPIQSFFTATFELVPGVPGSGTMIYSSVGEIVATPPLPIPEPSSLVLLGFGLVGLLTCGWRLPKRRV